MSKTPEPQKHKKPPLLKSTLSFGSTTFLSRILGFIRDVILAQTFGANLTFDAFIVAFKIPNFMRRLFAEGAFSQAFVPVLSEYQTKNNQAALKQMIAQVTGTLAGILAFITLIGIITTPGFITVFAPGFINQPEQFELASNLLRLTFPYIFFISLTALASGILNAHHHFAIPGVTPVWLNISLITCALYLTPYFINPIYALALGVLIAGIIQLSFQLPFLYKLDTLSKPVWAWRSPAVKKIIKLMIPALFGVSVAQINLLIDTLLASFLVSGSISWLYYSDRLLEFPVGIFGVAIATAILPTLSRQFSRKNEQAYQYSLDWALKWVWLITLPAMLGLCFLASPLLTTLFQYNAFTPEDVTQATKSLQAYALGLIGFIHIKVLASSFFARQDTKTPVKIAVIALAVNLILNLALIGPLKHAGLALATSLAALTNATLLFFHLRKQNLFHLQPGWLKFILKLVIANTAMLLILFWLNTPSTEWFNWDIKQRVWQLTKLITLAITTYFAVLLLFGIKFQTLLHPKTPDENP